MSKKNQNCSDCMARMRDVPAVQGRLESYCTQCRILNEGSKDGAVRLPFYTLEQLSEHLRLGLPILTLGGLWMMG